MVRDEEVVERGGGKLCWRWGGWWWVWEVRYLGVVVHGKGKALDVGNPLADKCTARGQERRLCCVD